jgi:orotidine-5'-phosphate decarboxylase
MSFIEKLIKAAGKNTSWLCVGLDPDPAKIPSHLGPGAEAVLRFNQLIIEATSDLVCAYKPNSAFYESLGSEGMAVLKDTIEAIPGDIPVILDFKRGDIGNTAAMYARSAFEYFGADAVTVNPYLGIDSVQPFIDYRDKGVFILCLTSNPSSADIQKKLVLVDEPPSLERFTTQNKARTLAEFFRCSTFEVYTHVARLAVEWNANGNIGLVVGANSTYELEKIRKAAGMDMPVLIPGVGAQGGDLEGALRAGSNPVGDMALINVSRDIIYSDNSSHFQNAVRQKGLFYREKIKAILKEKRKRSGTG